VKRSFTLAACLALGCRAAPIPADQLFPAGTPFHARELVVGDTRLRLIDTGSGPPVVFVHGLAASIYSWRYQLEPVLTAGYRVITFDNRGFGLSERPDHGYDNAAYAALLAALLDSLRINDAVVVGHSMGAAVAGEFALAHPARVRGLVLMGPAGAGPPLARALRWPFVAQLGTTFLSREGTAATLRSCFADPGRVTEADIDQYYAPLLQPRTGIALKQILRNFSFEALRDRLRQLDIPTLVLWGAKDFWIPFSAASQIAQELPRSAFVVLPDAGHNLQEEQHDEVNRSLIAFLRHGLPATPADLAAGRSNSAARSIPSRTHGD
jgi:pimeloyl-ACP methyl ester carboxylesterase